MAFAEMDSCFVRAIRYLHSTSNESQNNLRSLLDEAIKNKYGPGKEIGPLINFSPTFQEFVVANTSNVISSNDTVLFKDESKTGSSSDNELELDLLKEDLMCVICNGMGVGARNRLVECGDCHNLYHQECHDPSITEEEIEQGASWICGTCKDMEAKSVKKSATAQSSNVSSQKNSNQINQVSQPKVFSDKDYPDMSSVKPLTHTKGSSGGSSLKSSMMQNRVLTPNINIISADKRLQIMKKKAAKLQEKRKLSR